jgi:ankyrin repeat protein
MLINGKPIACIVLFITMFSFSENIYAQEKIDTSDYAHYSIPGSLEYNLMIASSKGYVSEIVRLLEKNAIIDAETMEGVTPLIFAVINGKTEAVKTLLKYKPELDKTTIDSETALLIAVKTRNFEITEALIRAGADINYQDKRQATPMHYASLYGYLEIVDLLLYYDAKIDEKTEEGSTPLIASIRAGYADIADLLVQNGAGLETKDDQGFTPFTLAAYYGDTLIMEILYRNGANIYAVNNKNHNSLNLAIAGNHPEAAAYLLRIGDKWSKQDVVSPYSVASAYRRNEVIEILKKNNVPGNIKYRIDQVAFSVSSRFGANDFFTGLSLSFKEPYLNGGFTAGCDVKLWYTKILIRSTEQLFYQYLDKGSIAYAGIFKDFALTDHPQRFNYVLSTSLLAGYTFGNKLKGSSYAPDEKLLLIPSVMLKVIKMNYSINAAVEYQRSEFYKNGPVWMRLGFSYNLYFDEVRTKVNDIKWL